MKIIYEKTSLLDNSHNPQFQYIGVDPKKPIINLNDLKKKRLSLTQKATISKIIELGKTDIFDKVDCFFKNQDQVLEIDFNDMEFEMELKIDHDEIDIETDTRFLPTTPFIHQIALEIILKYYQKLSSIEIQLQNSHYPEMLIITKDKLLMASR